MATPYISRVILFTTALALCLEAVQPQYYHGKDVKGPPTKTADTVKKIARIGDSVKLNCPIEGYPEPLFDWSKNDENIDFMWERHKIRGRSLRIRNVNEDDTGIFICKGINGFGSDSVRVELIVVDPLRFPPTLLNKNSVDTPAPYDPSTGDLMLAPPVFTHETRHTPRRHVKNVGDTFTVFCEALGSPQPEISWFKDGQPIDESVRGAYKGRSHLEFSILGSADSGTYTCEASNAVDRVRVNYELEVKQTVGTTHAIVTSAGPANTTVKAGESASLQCRVKSLAKPHIKWLKKLEFDGNNIVASSRSYGEERTLNVGHERYKILDSNQDIPTGKDEYLNILVLPEVEEADSGMYICFVTNSGFGALTYKSMFLRVVPNSGLESDSTQPEEKTNVDVSDHPTDFINKVEDEISEELNEEPLAILIVVICLSTLAFIFLLCITLYVIRKRALIPNSSSSSASTSVEGGESSSTSTKGFEDGNSTALTGELMEKQPFMIRRFQPLPTLPNAHPTKSETYSSDLKNKSFMSFWSYPDQALHNSTSRTTGGRNDRSKVHALERQFLQIDGGENAYIEDVQHPIIRASTAASTVGGNQYEVPYAHLSQHQHRTLAPTHLYRREDLPSALLLPQQQGQQQRYQPYQLQQQHHYHLPTSSTLINGSSDVRRSLRNPKENVDSPSKNSSYFRQ